MINKILLPTDGSEHSQKALDYTIDFALKFEADVVLVYVYDLPGEALGLTSGNQDIENSLRFYGDDLLKEYKEILENKGIKTRTLLLKGDTGEAISEISLDENCDIVIMGIRGLSTLKSLILGSASDYVLRHTKCPVLVIK
ncbi:universal stress protein [bacterium]|nr:MAG: universal stress protein [bacterium]